MKEYATGLGVGFRFDPMVNAGLDGAREPTNLRLAPEEVLELDLADAERAEEWRRFCARALQLAPDPERIYICSAGMRSFHIDPHGLLSVCIISRGRSYDLRRGSFHEAWHGCLPEVRDEAASGAYECNQCELISLCGQCPGWAQLEHGDQEKRVDFLCQVAHLRAQAFAAQPPAMPSQGIVVGRVDR